MRYVIYGAGAVGGTIGARLHLSGQQVTLIARGAHLAALQGSGLTFVSAEGTESLAIPAAASPAEIELDAEDVVVLAMKSQDTADALDALRAVAPAEIAIVCAQNGVANEGVALRRFANVYGQLVVLPATHLDPGVVIASASPTYGILDLGRFPHGSDDRAVGIAADLTAAGFSAVAREAIMPWKYAKLLGNLVNAAQAVLGYETPAESLIARAREEAVACLAAAGIERADEVEWRERFSSVEMGRAEGPAARAGGSTWQSLQRGTSSIEADYLNGEIVLMGRLHGVPTPVNAVLQQAANGLAASGRGPGTMTLAELEARLG